MEVVKVWSPAGKSESIQRVLRIPLTGAMNILDKTEIGQSV